MEKSSPRGHPAILPGSSPLPRFASSSLLHPLLSRCQEFTPGTFVDLTEVGRQSCGSSLCHCPALEPLTTGVPGESHPWAEQGIPPHGMCVSSSHHSEGQRTYPEKDSALSEHTLTRPHKILHQTLLKDNSLSVTGNSRAVPGGST